MKLLGQPRHRSLWHMIIAPTIWAVHFTVIYGFTAIACEKGIDIGTLRWTIALLTVLALGAIGVLAALAWRQWDYTDDYDYDHGGQTDEARREFLGHSGFLLAGVSAVGVIYDALPALFIASCI